MPCVQQQGQAPAGELCTVRLLGRVQSIQLHVQLTCVESDIGLQIIAGQNAENLTFLLDCHQNVVCEVRTVQS